MLASSSSLQCRNRRGNSDDRLAVDAAVLPQVQVGQGRERRPVSQRGQNHAPDAGRGEEISLQREAGQRGKSVQGGPSGQGLSLLDIKL